MLHPRLLIPTLQLPKALQHPDRDIVSLRQRILLAQTDPGPAAERQIAPARTQRWIRPALGSENVGVRAVDGALAHRRVDIVH